MTITLYAPNVHQGGGLILLNALCKVWPEDLPCTAFLDLRAGQSLAVPAAWKVHWVRRSFLDRLRAERQLANESKSASLVFCFHNLPPVFGCSAPVVCYVHNRNVVDRSTWSSFTGWVRLRLSLDQRIARTFRGNVDHYVVQTPTMARALRCWLGFDSRGREPSISQMPFLDFEGVAERQAADEAASPEWDFLYVSDGQAHKNHRRLFDAWEILSREGLKPSLAVTLHPERDSELVQYLTAMVARHGLNIVNLGHRSRDDILSCYRRAGAMLFPSYAESFGIPFLEARAANLPIIAAELDFVRDMCNPLETFDPFSAFSIARAVKRYLGKTEETLEPLTPTAFMDRLLTFQAGSR